MTDNAANSVPPPGRRRDANETTQVIQFDLRERPATSEARDRGVLTLLTGDIPGAVYVLEKHYNVLGRSQEADIQVEDAGLSRRHAQVIHEAGRFYIEDMGSTNGTYLNGDRVVSRRPLCDGDRLQIGQETVLRFSLQDALEQQAAQRMYESTVRDPLTQLHNRRYLDERLQGEFAYAVRHRTPLCVMLLDIDHFKQINDTLGHQAGDVVLQAMADALRRIVRTEDIAARYGGEEFVVVARGIDVAGAGVFAERVRRTIEGLVIPWEAQLIRVTVSVGVAQLRPNRPYPSPDALIAAADGALYNAKRGGRNRVIVSQ